MSGGRGQAVPNASSGGTGQPLFTVILPGFITPAASDVASTWLRIASPITLTGAKVYLVAKIAPSGGAAAISLLLSTDDGASFAALHTGTLSLPSGSKVATITPTWNVSSLAAGNLIRVDISTANASCSGLCAEVAS